MSEGNARGKAPGWTRRPPLCDLERFQMAVQRVVLIHPRELEVLKMEDFAIAQEKVTSEDTKKVNADTAKDTAT